MVDYIHEALKARLRTILEAHDKIPPVKARLDSTLTKIIFAVNQEFETMQAQLEEEVQEVQGIQEDQEGQENPVPVSSEDTDENPFGENEPDFGPDPDEPPKKVKRPLPKPKPFSNPKPSHQENSGKSRLFTLTLDTTLNFGKHRGDTVSSVLESDPGYLIWASTNVEWVVIPPDILEMARLAKEQQEDNKGGGWGGGSYRRRTHERDGWR
jgi:hypothetical protein